MALNLKSAAFTDGEAVPKKHTADGDDLSPPLTWDAGPSPTKEFALICDDPDAPTPEPWVHWVAYGIPGTRTSLPEGTAGGAPEGKNSWNRRGYGGPMPPPGHGTHHYHFKVYALDTPLNLRPGATKRQLLDAMKGHILDQGELVGTYER